MTTLSDKLKALGARTGARANRQTDQTIAPPSVRWAHPVEQAIPSGRVQETPDGNTFVVETSYPLDYSHGGTSLHITCSLSTIAKWACEPRLDVQSTQGFAFLDTETTGLAGGTGTYAFLVGIGRSDGETFRITQFFLREPSEEPALLNALSEYIRPTTALVTFNGKCFDAPLLDTRYITNSRILNNS